MATAKTYNGASYDATGITLSTSYNPVTITGDLVTSAINAVYGNNSYVWTVTNLGTVESTNASGNGIFLDHSGSVINGSATDQTALIAAPFTGVYIAGTGTVTNDGTISSPGGAGFGIFFTNGGTVTNGAPTVQKALISGYLEGIEISGSAGTVANDGTVTATGTSGKGVYFNDGGSVTNGALTAQGALISGYADAIKIAGAAGRVTNLGTVSATGLGSYGILLSAGGSVSNGAGKAPAALISGYADAIDISGAAGTVSNLGTVLATGSIGVYLAAGGSVSNGATNVGSALISGYADAIKIAGTTGTVLNFGTVSSTGSAGVELAAGGSVSNGASLAQSALISGHSGGILIFGAAGTVTNDGTVTSQASGVVLTHGGSVTNGAPNALNALISGLSSYGIFFTGYPGMVTNLGTVLSANRPGIDFQGGGGTVTNGGAGATKALISGYSEGINISGLAGTVTNLGTVTATGYGSDGILLFDGGSVSNGAAKAPAALISGYADGIKISGTAGTVTNLGTVASSGGIGVDLAAGGTVTNGAATARGALISGYSEGIEITGAAGTVTNLGTVSATGLGSNGVYLTDGGSVSNGSAKAPAALISGYAGGIKIAGAAGTVSNLGTVMASAGAGVFLANGGSVTNGATNVGSALISGFSQGVEIAGGGSVTNLGTVTGYRGIQLAGGGSVTNGAPTALNALISGVLDGVLVSGAGTVTNFGKVAATGNQGFAVYLMQGGSVTNGGPGVTTALISGYSIGVEIASAGGMVTNNGTIAATGTGGIGVQLKGVTVGTLTNSGVIAGAHDAVFLSQAAADVLVVNPGAVFDGAVYGGGTGKAIFTQAGVVNVNNFDGFAQITLASGAANTLTLDNANFTGVTGAVITVNGGNNGNTIDASALTGGNRVVIGGGIGTDVLTGGAGNDFFSLSAATLSASTVNGNGGNDVLGLTTAGALSLAGVSGIETITLKSGAANTLSLTNANFTGVTGAVITVNGGNNGNTIDASALTGGNRVVIGGGIGTDVLTGGAGNDFFSLSAATLSASTVNGNGGNDVLALTTAGALSLAGVSGVETITLKSGAANTLSLTNANFTGVTGAKITVAGGNNGDTLSESGVAATNLAVLVGGSGADTLIAGAHATLTGGLGVDAFEFVTPGSIATPDSNTVTDFVHGTDKFTFSDIGFNLGLAGATSTPQSLPSNLFSTKTDGTFDNTTERFAYNATTGQVIYSDDGSGADPSRAVATLTGHPTLTAGDLFFVT